jgi:chitin synthase
MESLFGYIICLPGAFSAYRYEAIVGVPLHVYFESLRVAPRELGAFRGNMYLCEDRILCFELFASKGKAWTLAYVKDALAETDVPTDVVALLKQRRRWLNGSLYTVSSVYHWSSDPLSSSYPLARSNTTPLHLYPPPYVSFPNTPPRLCMR